ncbi:hypothetical protein GCM10023195_12880 [Actinoallomurus liliacearum]|uniref:HTH cro/C1-type domain-containing protein n=1 Tax=Actinoallomurus liliacearum TaxID=1080073 RepID=A0ABP8TFA0_9ACTN
MAVALNPSLREARNRRFAVRAAGPCYVARVDSTRREEIAAELRATAAAQDWTPWQLAQALHEKAQTPTMLMAWRLAMGQTQAEVVVGLRGLAADEEINCGPTTQQLSRWENGHETPGPIYRPLFGLWYRTTLNRLGLTDDHPIVTLMKDAVPDEEDPVRRREFFQAAAVTPILVHLERIRTQMDSGLRHVLPTADVEHWQEVATGHIASYGQFGPRDLLNRLAPDLEEIAGLIERYPREKDLLLIASRLGGLTGALWTDLEDDRQARAWLHTADRYAAQAGDTTQRYWIAMARAMIAIYGPQPAAVLPIAARARAELGDAPSAPAAQLAGLAARAHASLGPARAEQARAELRRAEHLTGQLTTAQTGEQFFGFPERELAAYASWVLTAVKDSGAWAAQERALAEYPANDPMDRPLILLSRARLLVERREAAEATRVAGDAITMLPTQLRVPLLMTQASRIAVDLDAVSPSHARQLRERLAA